MSILVWGIVVFLALAWLAHFLKQPGVKGSLGEWRVRLLALHGLDSKVYYGLHNVTLPTLKGTTQIDHLFVSRYGIFVLETKNMRGWISGVSKTATGRSSFTGGASHSRTRCGRTIGISRRWRLCWASSRGTCTR